MRKVLGNIKHYLKRYKIINTFYYGLKNSRRKKTIKKEGINVIKIVDDIFTQLGIDYFLDFGTLLGFIRDSTFISNDIDIDIGIPYSDDLDKKAIEKKMQKYGYKKAHEFEYKNTIVEQAYIIKGIRIDLFYYESDSTHSYCYLFYRDPQIKYPNLEDFSVYRFTYDKIEGIERRIINNLETCVPQNAEYVLIQKYGKQWNEPDENWSFFQAPTIRRLKGYGRIIR